jgi:hypothetical protein
MNEEGLESISKSNNYVTVDFNVDLVLWNVKVDLRNANVWNHSSIGEHLGTKADGDIQCYIGNSCIDRAFSYNKTQLVVEVLRLEANAQVLSTQLNSINALVCLQVDVRWGLLNKCSVIVNVTSGASISEFGVWHIELLKEIKNEVEVHLFSLLNDGNI